MSLFTSLPTPLLGEVRFAVSFPKTRQSGIHPMLPAAPTTPNSHNSCRTFVGITCWDEPARTGRAGRLRLLQSPLRRVGRDQMRL